MTPDLRAAAQAAFDTWLIDEDGSDTDKAMYALRAVLAAPGEPDVLPGLRLALEKLRPCLGLGDGRVAIRAEIARREVKS